MSFELIGNDTFALRDVTAARQVPDCSCPLSRTVAASVSVAVLLVDS